MMARGMAIGLLVATGCGGSVVGPEETAGPVDAETAPDAEGSLDTEVTFSGDAPPVGPWQVSVAAAGPVYDVQTLMLHTDGVPHVAFRGVKDDAQHLYPLHHAWAGNDELLGEEVSSLSKYGATSWVVGAPQPTLLFDGKGYSVPWQATRDADSAWGISPFVDLPSALAADWHDGRLQLARVTDVDGGYAETLGSNLRRHGVALDEQTLPDASTHLAGLHDQPLIAFATDGTGVTHIVYSAPVEIERAREVEKTSEYEPNTIEYVTLKNGVWSTPESLAPANSTYSRLWLAVDSAGTLHVTFSERVTSPSSTSGQATQVNHLVHRVGSPWERGLFPASISAGIGEHSLALDAAGELHAVYSLRDDGGSTSVGVGYAHEHDGTWSTETIQAPCAEGPASSPVLTLGGGTLYAAYAGCGGEIMMATRTMP